MPGSPIPTAARTSSRAIPVGLNEAALDSPTFRVTAAHFAEQTDIIERWLNGYVTSTSKLTHDVLALEETINSYLGKTMPSAADGVVDNDYTFLALKRVGDGTREYWQQMLSTMKKMDTSVCEPIRAFLGGELRNFKECRRALEQSQRTFDSTLARYVSQSKTKEPSSLREDAFAVYETRKAYLKASMDYCQLGPQLRFTMDKLLVQICGELWKEMKRCRDAVGNATRWSQEMDRIRGWSKEMESSESILKRELLMARRGLGESTMAAFKPSRELEDYSTSTVPFLGSRGPVSMTKDGASVISEKQGWLFLRMVTGKPARHTWIRRWYYCRDGIFGWLIPGPLGVLQGDEIGVLLCNAKPAVGEERRFCFEVKTKSQTILLQAETQGELTEWLEVFEVTKKKAFETTMNRNTASIPGSVDPAFSISPPSIPEFSAKILEAQIGLYDESGPNVERTGTLAIPGPDGNLAPRQSFDINGSLSRRSITAMGRDLLQREEGEGGREHAARIIQKFDLHRKATFGGAGTELGQANYGGSSNGIASLLSSSHGSLPGYTPQAGSTTRQTPNMLPSVDTSPGTLAPLTLVKPPSLTGLSRTAVMAAGERVSLGNSRKLPSSVVANYWGSSVWGALHGPAEPVLPRLDENDPIGVVVPGSTQNVLSKDGEQHQAMEMFPRNYPPELKAQHAQFRLLFPDVSLGEKLVLVFRAAWNSSAERHSDQPDMSGDGRIYVTQDNMYFYGQQFGLVTAYRISLDIITEVTAAPGRDCDYIFLHLGQGTNETGYTRITIKVFLEELGLLHTRLNLLVDDLQAEEPMEIEEMISALISLEKEEFERPSPSVESWEEVSANTPIDDGTLSGRAVSRRQNYFNSRQRSSKSRVRPTHKPQLPAHPVIYEPEGMKEMAAERNFEISAKACFHVLFGDKSFVFPKLYFERRAQQIAQGPWLLVDQGRMRRDFQFKVDYKDILGRSKTANVNDYQTMDVFSDHVTYVVTHVKTAWHLPHSSWFTVVTKIVITHMAKSKCKLAIYIKIDWSKLPALSKNLVERQALRDAASDAEELAEVATDQVRKLGPRSRTNRAIQVYGQIGQQTQVVVFSPAATDTSKKQAVKLRTLTTMLFETIRSFGESAVSSLIMWAFAVLRSLFKMVTAQRIILGLLAFSTLTNLLLTSSETSTWWGERRAAAFMQNIGIRPNNMMSKAVYVADLSEAVQTADHEIGFPQNSTCFATFKELLDTTDMDSPWEDAGSSLSWPSSRSTARRLRRTRQRLGSHRHDLLVAMRVVNSIEREMLHSEWENWLVSEKVLCDDLDTVLDKEHQTSGGKAKQDSTSQKIMKAMSPDRQRALGEWRDGHCGSCRSDHQAVMQQRMIDTPSLGTLDFLFGTAWVETPGGPHGQKLRPTPQLCHTFSAYLLFPQPQASHKQAQSLHDPWAHPRPADIMVKHHEPLQALGPVEWDQIPKDSIKEFLDDILTETQTIVESIPVPATRAAVAASATATGRPRAKTESAVLRQEIQRAPSQRQTAVAISQAQDLRKEWKEVKVKDNPLDISVYKLSAKDGKGAWFARRSVHEGLTFDKWKEGLEMEFAETMKIQGSPGSGNIRGIGAEKRVENQPIDEAGQLQVFQLSAQFPGPTTPRDFVTLLLTSETTAKPADGSRPLRQFMIVSKPCDHAECPPRPGIIRGVYESCEIIREIPIENPSGKRSLSSVDLSRRRSGVPGGDGEAAPAEDFATAVEWLMVTRSDPGGSVPRFLIEKGTPPGIVGDAGKFVKWVTSKSLQGFTTADEDAAAEAETGVSGDLDKEKSLETPRLQVNSNPMDRRYNESPSQGGDETVPSSNGLYGIIYGAIGAASSIVANNLFKPFVAYSDTGSNEGSLSDVPPIQELDEEDQETARSETSSIRSFASAVEMSTTDADDHRSPESTAETHSETQSQTSRTNISTQRDKELRKLEDRRRKLAEKVTKMQERMNNKQSGEKDKDVAALAKLREKHEKDVAKQEEKYRRELRKIEEKREAEERKVEERKRKAAEREEKSNLALELDKVKAERDLARSQIAILEGQVGELQAQNTLLARKMGKMGLLERSDSSTSFRSLAKPDGKCLVELRLDLANGRAARYAADQDPPKDGAVAETLGEPLPKPAGGLDGEEGLAEDALDGGGARVADVVVVVVEGVV
ncbi:hypothetical protein G7046_g9242 [Stylonectria norvegica]|nr:hypothetical protein G7046_g9242 [Stylonectria norvegica]